MKFINKIEWAFFGFLLGGILCCFIFSVVYEHSIDRNAPTYTIQGYAVTQQGDTTPTFVNEDIKKTEIISRFGESAISVLDKDVKLIIEVKKNVQEIK